MKISLIGPTYPFRGGISHHTTLLYRHLRKRHEVQFWAFKRQYPQWLFPGKTDFDPSHVHIQEEGVSRLLDSMDPISWLRVAWNIIHSHQDLLIIPWWVSFWTPQFFTISFLVKLFSQTKILFICHNVVEHESSWIDRILTRVVLRHGDAFLVHSEEDKSDLLTMIPEARVRKSFHPLYDAFQLRNFNGTTIKERYGIEGKVVLFFGFVREYKGLKYLIQALPDVLSEVNATLLIVGEFWRDKSDYLRLIKDLKLDNNTIIIDEYIPNEDVGLYFSTADLVVQPYISATGSGVIQIAFAFHKPVIATRVGCLSEVVDDGKTGYLVPPKSSSELAKAIINFFQNKRSVQFTKNIEKANDKFSWDHIVNMIEELILS